MSEQRFLEVAQAAAAAAADIIRYYYRAGVAVQEKADATPVTRADVESEQAIREIIEGAFPDHGFFGEETGQAALDAEYLWLVDPIDGTKAFVRGYPMFSTQIALMHRGELVLGVSSAPEFGELLWAQRGAGAWEGDRRLGVSAIDRLEDCALSSGNLKSLAAGPAWGAYGRLVARVNRIRGYGDFLHYHLLARGAIDAVIESDVNILDIAALAVIVTEAGGRFTDLEGQPVGLATTSVLASTPRLHSPLQAALADRTD
ncbi:MAG: inositol-phosphate phosphatase [Gammaproteobacteria bacterium]|nr:MAG: inositol-phosphate phosphatase [Gammaproteobacteria bacterium]